MISHLVLGSSDLDRSRRFYDATLAPLGMRRIYDDDTRSIWAADWRQLVVTLPIDGEPATSGNGFTLCLSAPDRSAVDDAYAAGAENGGTADGAPGSRKKSTSYVAYVRDPEGNKLCLFDASGEPWHDAVAALSRRLAVEDGPT